MKETDKIKSTGMIPENMYLYTRKYLCSVEDKKSVEFDIVERIKRVQRQQMLQVLVDFQ